MRRKGVSWPVAKALLLPLLHNRIEQTGVPVEDNREHANMVNTWLFVSTVVRIIRRKLYTRDAVRLATSLNMAYWRGPERAVQSGASSSDSHFPDPPPSSL